MTLVTSSLAIRRLAASVIWPLRIGLAVIVLAFFLLPDTFLGRLLPLQTYDFLEQDGIYFTLGQEVLLLPIIALVWLSYERVSRADANAQRLWLLLGGLFAVHILYCFYPPLRLGTLRCCIYLLAPIGAGLLATRLCGRFRYALVLLLALVLLQEGYAFTAYLHAKHIVVSGTVRRAGGTFDAPNTLGLMAAAALPITCLFLLEPRPLWQRALSGLCLCGLMGLLALSGSRAAALGLAVATVWMLWKVTEQRRQSPLRSAWFWGGITASLGAILFINGMRLWGHINRVSTDRSSLGHLRLWRHGFHVFAKHWLFGAGLGYISLATEDNIVDYVAYDPENLLLQWLEQFGVIGGVLFLLAVYLVVRAIKGRSLCHMTLQAMWAATAIVGCFNPVLATSSMAGGALVGVLLGSTLLLPADSGGS
jgi:O-antigen ligase